MRVRCLVRSTDAHSRKMYPGAVYDLPAGATPDLRFMEVVDDDEPLTRGDPSITTAQFVFEERAAGRGEPITPGDEP